MINILKRICIIIFISGLFICVYQNIVINLSRCSNDEFNFVESCFLTLWKEDPDLKGENEFDEMLQSNVPKIDNTFNSGFESDKLNSSERNVKTNHDIQTEQNPSLCFGNNDINSLNQTFVHLKPLHIDCLSSTDHHRKSNVIYFLECGRNTGFKFKSIHWCSIESAAFRNPKKSVVVVFLFYNAFSAPSLLKKLTSKYKNIYFLSLLNLKKFVSGSPYEKDLKCSRKVCELLESSIYPEYHYSDLLRLLLVYKFGGIYSDLDIVTLKSFPENLEDKNLLAADTSSRLGNCFLKFEKGHSFPGLAMKNIISNFNGTEWSANGPPRLTETLKNYCDKFNRSKIIPKGSFGFRNSSSKTTSCIRNHSKELEILSPTFISRIHWHDVDAFFGRHNQDDWMKDIGSFGVINQIRRANSLGVHFYNKITNKRFGRKYYNKELPFKKIFRENCPLTYNEWYV